MSSPNKFCECGAVASWWIEAACGKCVTVPGLPPGVTARRTSCDEHLLSDIQRELDKDPHNMGGERVKLQVWETGEVKR